MGMFDTIYFDRKYPCPICGNGIADIQTKEFENLLNNYSVKDCISHAEDVRITKDELFCNACSRHTGKYVYVVVVRGILIGITESFNTAKELINDLNLEKLILWYHDLYKKYIQEQNDKGSYSRFLSELSEWYGKRLYLKKDDERKGLGFYFLGNLRHLRGALSPVESVERFLTYRKMIKTLDNLWGAGHEILDIYYPEDIKHGDELWSVDVYQDEINEQCHLNWTWTVISRKQIETEGEREDHLPEWSIVIDAPFSEDAIKDVIEKWLRERGHSFTIRLITINEAKGSGLLKEIRNRTDKPVMEETIPFEDVMKQLSEEGIKEKVKFIESRKDRRVFYYEGLHGSLVPDIENDRLMGKIEGIEKDIVFEGKTVRECEERFREAVSNYLNTIDKETS